MSLLKYDMRNWPAGKVMVMRCKICHVSKLKVLKRFHQQKSLLLGLIILPSVSTADWIREEDE